MLKVITKEEVLKYTPLADRESEKPTIICYKPMTKKQFDRYIDSLAETRRGKIKTKTGQSGEILFGLCLAPDDKGVFIYNVEMDGAFVAEIKEKDKAIDFLLGLRDVETANEIERAMRGQSELTEDEEGN